jgi:hypothetical protein
MTDTRYYPEEDLYIICLVNTSGGPKKPFRRPNYMAVT